MSQGQTWLNVCQIQKGNLAFLDSKNHQGFDVTPWTTHNHLTLTGSNLQSSRIWKLLYTSKGHKIHLSKLKFCKCSNDGVMLSTPEARFFSTFQTKKNGTLGSLTASFTQVKLFWFSPPVLAPLALMPVGGSRGQATTGHINPVFFLLAPEAHRCLMRNRKTWASNRIPFDDWNPDLIGSWSYAKSNELGRDLLFQNFTWDSNSEYSSSLEASQINPRCIHTGCRCEGTWSRWLSLAA